MLMLMIVLLNGSEALINPREIVSMLEARDADDPGKRYTGDVRCVITMTDGHRYTTREECPMIATRLRKLEEKQP